MHYPFWHVPGLTAPMLIAFIAVFHIFVALYAVGGGLFLAVETRFAYQKGRKDYLEYLHLHTRFFILLTVGFSFANGVFDSCICFWLGDGVRILHPGNYFRVYFLLRMGKT
ncbi:MAG: hypothetical protein HYY57_00675 [Candidatus Omnitrophica bacterium]|nr:hypothetical protein [Candidatus Omnitrophota bacterium]